MDRSADWMRQAEWDLQKAARDTEAQFYEWACFTAHQAAEKALKALYQHLHAVAWGHSLMQLVQLLPASHTAPSEVLAAAQRLDHYYIPTRYPNGFPSGTPHDYFAEAQAREAEEDARRIVVFCRSHLS